MTNASQPAGVPQSKFVYVTYIKTTQEKLWEALTSREFMAQYWLGNQPEADWRVGGSWKIVRPNGEPTDTGEILELEPGKRIVIKWRNEFMPELTVTHTMERADSKLIAAVGGGWPLILSNLKSVLETGVPLLTKK